MNTEWFETFLEAVRLKSLSKAADRLHLTQPAASKQLHSLEEALGVKLLERSPAGVAPTAAGQKLYDRLVPVVSELAAIRRELKETAQPVRLGAIPSLAAHYLPQRLARLQPPGAVQLAVYGTSAEQLAALTAGTLDAALVESRYAAPPYWSAEVLTEPYCAVMPQTHPLAARAEVTLEELAEERLIVHPPACDIRRSIAEAYEARRLAPLIGAEVGFGESIIGFVAAGAGITIMPRLAAEHAGRLGLAAVPVSGFGRERTIVLLAASAAIGQALMPALTG
ncbi:LysR family transcriptional regulator [Paenibacillus hamazuiensis]|uniref:LysR family transcriptional regulator n=1 Tax=Paenibacillus hamazuiensis TaxID=2936508 RepID=UPI00200DD5CA|nr:LysR family transcriptional regulator [Paenibacillus hamazuiensis]